MPRIAGERLPATYINHYTANGGAVVPQFGFNAAGTDERALEDISKAYNGERKVRNVNVCAHCILSWNCCWSLAAAERSRAHSMPRSHRHRECFAGLHSWKLSKCSSALNGACAVKVIIWASHLDMHRRRIST